MAKCDFVFVDFFDTVIFRRVTVNQALNQWAYCLKRKIPELEEINEKQLINYRKSSFARLKETGTEPTLSEALQLVYNELPQIHTSVKRENFVHVATEIDVAVEYGCQYPNTHILNILRKYKQKGKKIICISDYYYNSEILKQFLFNCNISSDLFDDFYVSCEYRKSKFKGTLYQHVLKILNIGNPSNVMMIGDNPYSDMRQAKLVGLKTHLRRHLLHKAFLYINRRKNYSNKQIHYISKYCYKNGYPFSEYIIAFYSFTKKLFVKLNEDEVENAVFMAREGYYLKDLFENYCNICIPENRRIYTSYFRCSRRSIFAGVDERNRVDEVREPISIRNWLKSYDLSIENACKMINIDCDQADEVYQIDQNPYYIELMNNSYFQDLYKDTVEKNSMAFKDYIKRFIDNGRFTFIDSGWKGTTQEALYKYYNIPSTGYYIGIQNNPNCSSELIRNGLLFCENDGKYYDYIGMNFPFYQELLAAPHGSAIKYISVKNDITVKEEWDEIEKSLYDDCISNLQAHMNLIFCGLCAWNSELISEKEDWIVAKTIFHSNMFSFGERLKFALKCENSFLINFQQEKKGAKDYNYHKVDLKADILINPKKYIRFITKIQRSNLYKNKLVRLSYPVVAFLFYRYVLFIHFIGGKK